MSVGVIALEFEDAPELLTRLREAIHIKQQRSKIKECLDIARMRSQLAQIELASSIKSTEIAVSLREARVDAGHVRIKGRRLPQRVNRLLSLAARQERVRQIDACRRLIDALEVQREVVVRLGGFVIAIAGMRLNQMDHRIRPRRLEPMRRLQRRDRVGRAIEAQHRDAERRVRLNIRIVEIE